jgi:hypothetical protein
MVWAQFEEKHYEILANIELAGNNGSANIFPPGQVLEGILGFDVASDPRNPAIWKKLGIKKPKGLQLRSSFYPSRYKRKLDPKLPSFLVSLIIQYKRPEYMTRIPKAVRGQGLSAPCYKFRVSEGQHKTLMSLESMVQPDALVRYAAPAFWMISELYSHQHHLKVIKNSFFIVPDKKKPTGCWYEGANAKGTWNPEPLEAGIQRFDELVEYARKIAKKTTFAKHVDQLAGALGLVDAKKDSEEEVPPEDLRLSDEHGESFSRAENRRLLLNTVTVADRIGRAGADWWVVDFGEDKS